MRYYVVYDAGTCNQGDHDNGCRPFTEYVDAIRFFDECARRYGMNNVTLVHGTEVSEYISP